MKNYFLYGFCLVLLFGCKKEETAYDINCNIKSGLRILQQNYQAYGPNTDRYNNAVDKVIGAALQCNLNFEKTILNCSGRLSSDMILKTCRAQIPIVISRTAPTTLAVDIANECGITLIGFARGTRLNIYSHAERISYIDEQNERFITELIEKKESEKAISDSNINLNQFQEVQ